MPELNPLTLPLNGRSLIEAAAGTGKTWTLTLLVLRLILERDLGIEDMLILTYTRAAAAELKTRVRARLRAARQYVSRVAAGLIPPDEEKADPALSQMLRSEHAPAPAEALLRLDNALSRLDEATITTIHGFCQRLLNEQALVAGLAFDRAVLPDENDLRAEIMADFWRLRFYAASRAECALALHFWPQGPESLLADVTPGLDVPDERVLPRMPDPEAASDEALAGMRGTLADVRTAWRAEGEAARDFLVNDKCLSRSKENYRDDQVDLLLAELESLLRLDPEADLPCLLPERLALLDADAMRDRRDRRLKKCRDFTAPDFFVVFGRFWAAYRACRRLWRLARLLAARRYLREELAARKARQNLMGYDDMIRLAAQALDHPERGPALVRALRRRCKAVLVDEFQDTDPDQYRIFSALAAEPDFPCIMIGDPKQAIYAFRGGDIFSYLAARRDTPEERRFHMTTNHRSAAGMVNAVNHIFSRRDTPFLSPAIPFQKVRPGPQAEESALLLKGAAPAPLGVLLLDATGAGKAGLAKDAADVQAVLAASGCIRRLLDMADQGRALIREPEGKRRLQAGDIAILCPTHHQGDLMRQALLRQGIASVSTDRSSVFAGPEAAELEILLQALLNPSDPNLTAQCLATSLFGLTAAEIDQARQDAALWDEHAERLKSYRRHWDQWGIGPTLHRIFRREPRGLAACSTGDAPGERRITNFLHLADLVHELENAAPGRERLARRLTQERRRAAQGAAAPEDQLMRLESDAALIRISTQHSAKGLEYPVVFLPFLWRAREWQQRGSFIFHDPDTLAACLDFESPDSPNLRLARDEDKAERRRLLYVALTRAKFCTFFCWGRVRDLADTPLAHLLHSDAILDDEQLTDDLETLNRTDDGELAQLYPPEVWSAWAEAGERRAPEPTEDRATLRVRSFAGPVRPGWINHSYSALAAGREQSPEDEDRELEPVRVLPRRAEDFADIPAFPRGAWAGSCLHALLEGLDFTCPAAEQTLLVEQTLTRFGFAPAWTPALAAWLDGVLAAPLPGARPLLGLAPTDALRELTFLFTTSPARLCVALDLPQTRGVAAGGLMKGAIDLVFRHEGRFAIVDYKSNALAADPSGYTPEAMDAEMIRHRYDAQYLIYTLALHRHLRARLPDYDYDRHFAGAYYLFVRGMAADSARAVYFARPDRRRIEELDALCPASNREEQP